MRALSSVVVYDPPRPPDDGRETRSRAAAQAIRWREWRSSEARRRSSDPAAGARSSPEAVAGAAQLACVLEASAEKPGNITPRHDFADTSYEDMLRSAIALGPELGAGGRARRRRHGARGRPRRRARVAGAQHESRHRAAARAARPRRAARRAAARAARRGGARRRSTLDDARAAYAAIREAGAGGLDEPVEHDVRDAPTVALREAMAAAAGRDSVAAEYATGFAITFDIGLPALRRALAAGLGPRAGDRRGCSCALLAAVPDTLIARKRGRRGGGARVGGRGATCWPPGASATTRGAAPSRRSTPRSGATATRSTRARPPTS